MSGLPRCKGNRKVVVALFLSAACTLGAVAGPANLLNGGFESGTVAGWTIGLAGDLYVNRSQTINGQTTYERNVLYPYESATVPVSDVLASWPYLVSVRADAAYAPEGISYLRLRGGAVIPLVGFEWEYGGWVNTLMSYGSVTIGQSVSLQAGQRLVFQTDYHVWCPNTNTEPASLLHDPVWAEVNGVDIMREDTSLVAPPSPPGAIEDRSTGWRLAAFDAPADGTYTLSFHAGQECQFGGYLDVDAVQVIPEPSLLALALVSFFCLGIRARRR